MCCYIESPIYVHVDKMCAYRLCQCARTQETCVIMIPRFLFHYLQSFSPLNFFFLEKNKSGITNAVLVCSQELLISVPFLLLLLLIIHKHYGLSRFFVFMHNINSIFLSHCPWQIYQLIDFPPRFCLPYPGFLCE